MVLSHEQAVLIAHFELKRISVLRKQFNHLFSRKTKTFSNITLISNQNMKLFQLNTIAYIRNKKTLFDFFSNWHLFLFSLSITMTIVFISDDENDTLQ